MCPEQDGPMSYHTPADIATRFAPSTIASTSRPVFVDSLRISVNIIDLTATSRGGLSRGFDRTIDMRWDLILPCSESAPFTRPQTSV